MARGPFQGTYQHGIRPTVATSPDAMVFVNGESDILGCPKCRRKLDLNRYITTIQVDLSVDSVPGSASFNLSIPRHSIDDFYFDGAPLLQPMMEVEIFAKGYFLIEGMPQYYPIFWGLITDVGDSYSGGEHTLSVNCADILKWWSLCQMNINPAFTQAVGQQGKSIFGNVFFGKNPYDVIWTLAQQSFGDVVVGSGSLITMTKEATQRANFSAYMGDVMAYWESRFSRIRSNLLLYGTNGTAVRGDVISEVWKRTNGTGGSSGEGFVSKLVRTANGGDSGAQMVFDPTDKEVTAFRTQFSNAGQVNFWQSEFTPKLDLANSAKDSIGYEFYMDVTGDIVFKPPFYNLDILSNKPVSWIQDIDIIDWNLSESEAEVVTQIQLQGSFQGNIDYAFGEEMTPTTTVTDYHLLRKYGWRVKPFTSEFMASPQGMFYAGMDMLDQYNARRFRGSIGIPLRPELRLGFPVYLASKDQIWYVTGISHNITFGGRAQTTLTLTAKRGKFIAPKGIGSIGLTSEVPKGTTLTAREITSSRSFLGEVGDAAQIPPANYPENPGDSDPYAPLILRHPKTGRVVGYPNVVMAYTRPFMKPTDREYNKLAGQKNASEKAKKKKDSDKDMKKELGAVAASIAVSKEDAIRNKFLHNRFSFGLTSAGVYTYLRDTSAVVKEVLLMPKEKVKFKDVESNKNVDVLAGSAKSTAMIRPVSDERGFEVIGHYKYGRNVSLRDGSLVLDTTGKNDNTRAQIATQTAISGDLFEVLQSQSQGLVSVFTGYPNPAHAMATLSPTDMQTAGVMTPSGSTEFVVTDTNFVDTAPLGSPKQSGVASVEASQLSRALTLAELQVYVGGEAPSEECGCITSRADLAFLNYGYQTKTLRGTAGESLADGSDSPDAELGAIAMRQQDIAATLAAANNPDAVEKAATATYANYTGTSAAQAAEERAVTALAAKYQISKEQVRQEALSGAAQQNRPIVSVTLTREEAISRVDTFLTDLYAALDKPHQVHERKLRGLSDAYSEEGSSSYTNPNTTEDLAPPFSPAGRKRGGDVSALALQGSSARSTIAKEWQEFSSELRDAKDRTYLEQEVRRLRRKVQELQRDLADAQAHASSGGLLTTTGNDPKSLETALAEAEKELAAAELALSEYGK